MRGGQQQAGHRPSEANPATSSSRQPAEGAEQVTSADIKNGILIYIYIKDYVVLFVLQISLQIQTMF